MWGQLRKGIGESVLSKIGEVVAPPPDYDEDEYDSASSYEEEGEEEYIDYVDYDDDDDKDEGDYENDDDNEYNNEVKVYKEEEEGEVEVYKEEEDEEDEEEEAEVHEEEEEEEDEELYKDDEVDDNCMNDDDYNGVEEGEKDEDYSKDKRNKECTQMDGEMYEKERGDQDAKEYAVKKDEPRGNIMDNCQNDNDNIEKFLSAASVESENWKDDMKHVEDVQYRRDSWQEESHDSVSEKTTAVHNHENEHPSGDVLEATKLDYQAQQENMVENIQHDDSQEPLENVDDTTPEQMERVKSNHESNRKVAPIEDNLTYTAEEEKFKNLKELLAMKDNQIKELERAQKTYKAEMERRFSLDTEQWNCKLKEMTKELKNKEAEIELNRQHLEDYKLLVQEQHTNEVEQLRTAANRAMLELNERTNEVTKLQQHLEDVQSEIENRHESELLKLEQLLKMTKNENEKKSEEIQKLQSTAEELRQSLKSKQKELDEVDNEADELHQLVEDLEASNGKLKERVAQLENDSKDALGLHIEMQLLKEERDREALKASTLQESKESNQAVLTAELNAARAEVLDLEQRLTALQADLDVARADKDRAIMASSNLQRAMEAFESEREAEIEILEESRKSSEEAILAAHDLALQALKKDNDRIIEEMQIASNKAITNMMEEIKDMERKQEEYLRENVNLRRSLDEAIQRLHSKEEDVIDRSLMKNILLDWHSKSGKAKREVLSVMSSVLHFTEEEKVKCGLTESQHTISKVVGTLAPPLNPAAKSVEELDGDNIREKWVSFLLAECGDSPQRRKASTAATQKRNQRSTEATAI